MRHRLKSYVRAGLKALIKLQVNKNAYIRGS
jgi:hypothetical protein